MKTTSRILCGALLSGLCASPTLAKTITVQVIGHVTSFNDSSGALGLQVGQQIIGSYTYETNTPDQDSSGNGLYHPAVALGSVQAKIGALQLQSATTSQYTIYVQPSAANHGGWGEFVVDSQANQPLANGTQVTDIGFAFWDQSGQMPATDALLTGAPDLTHYTWNWIYINNNAANFSINGQIDSVALVPPALEVSPSDEDFLRQQRIDAALLLPVGAQVSTMQASIGGTAIPLSYPGTCQLAQANLANRPAILCADAQTVFPSAGGPTQIDWQVTLSDGTVVTQSSHWNLIP